MRTSFYSLAPLALLFLTGCPDDPCTRADRADPDLAIGMGEKAFEALADGDEAVLTYGNQGGQHIWVALQASGVNPGEKGVFAQDRDPVTITLALEGMTDGWDAGSYYSNWVAMAGSPEESEITGLQLVVSLGYFDTYGEAPQPVDQEYLLTAEVADVCGNTVSAERIIRLPE